MPTYTWLVDKSGNFMADTAVAPDPLIGTVVDDRYLVEHFIARGGMANVYRATDTRLGRHVAFKVMHPQFAADPDFVARFRTEAQALASLSHPNVVSVFDQGFTREHAYLVMEFVPNTTLREELVRAPGHRLSERRSLEIIEQTLLAVEAAHQADIVHRDVKPENILLAQDGRIRVTDFGLAQALGGSPSTTGLLIGTAAYMAPERVERRDLDHRCDIYSAGVVLFETLTGRTPYAGSGAMELAYQHVNEQVPVPSSVVPGLSASVDRIVARATSRSLDERYATAAQFRAEVLAVLQSMGGASAKTVALDLDQGVMPQILAPTQVVRESTYIESAPRPDLPSAVRSTRRGRALMGLVALATIAALSTGSVWWWISESYVRLPKLSRMSENQARSQLRQYDLRIKVDRAPSTTIPEGSVIRTEPKSGSRIRKGSGVTLILSEGPALVTIPNVVGLSQEEAQVVLTSGGFEVEFQNPVVISPLNRVVSQTPGSGELAPRGAKIIVRLF